MIPGRYVPVPGFKSPFPNAPVFHCRETQSTMLDAHTLADDWADGTVLWADFQHAGRGRGAGRRWDAAPGANLTFTLLVSRDAATPKDDRNGIGAIPLRAGLAIAEAAVALGLDPRNVRIKWPNDVLVDGRKLCGILCEGRSGAAERFHIGIGLNVNQEIFPGDVVPAPVSLAQVLGRTLDRRTVLMSVLTQLRWALRSSGWRAAVEQRLFRAGAAVTVMEAAAVSTRSEPAARAVDGQIRGIGADGSLRVRRADGSEFSVLQPDAVRYRTENRSSTER